jgi:fluoride exporter
MMPQEEILTYGREKRIYSQIALVISLSMAGDLIRIYSLQLKTAVIPAIVFPQMIGCFILGWVSSCKYLLKYPNLKVGLATGLCGSITSFSSASLAIFLAFIDIGLLSGFSMIIAIYGLSFASFGIGQHLSLLPCWDSLTQQEPLEDKFLFASTAVILISVVIWCVLNIKLYLPLSMLLGSFGSLIRFYLSLTLNSKIDTFPLGSFLANILGTTILSILFISNNTSTTEACAWNYALSIGFCGCLTTISTFIAELGTLGTRHSYVYGFCSILSGLAINILIIGTFIWTNNSFIQCSI